MTRESLHKISIIHTFNTGQGYVIIYLKRSLIHHVLLLAGAWKSSNRTTLPAIGRTRLNTSNTYIREFHTAASIRVWYRILKDPAWSLVSWAPSSFSPSFSFPSLCSLSHSLVVLQANERAHFYDTRIPCVERLCTRITCGDARWLWFFRYSFFISKLSFRRFFFLLFIFNDIQATFDQFGLYSITIIHKTKK